MANLVHTPECLAFTAQLAAWNARWPAHCPHCGGSGVVYVEGDWVPYGEGNAQLPGGEELCEHCVEEGKCP